MIEDSESQELIQIDHAARGMVSGTLAEWPHLKSALRRRGISLPDSASAMELKRICAVWWEENMTSNQLQTLNDADVQASVDAAFDKLFGVP